VTDENESAATEQLKGWKNPIRLNGPELPRLPSSTQLV
jgi:hypothetical protein